MTNTIADFIGFLAFQNLSSDIVKLDTIEKFLKLIRKHTNEKLTILLLGGEPTTVGAYYLIKIADLAHRYNFRVTMSTNGYYKGTINDCVKYLDAVQVTAHNKAEIDYWSQLGDKVNLKIAADKQLTLDKFEKFIEYTNGKFYRRSITMYFTPDFKELCEDKEMWDMLNTLEWKRNGGYMYAYYKGVRIKRCIHGETNIIDEPTIPKLYPNGNYNKTWCNEDMDSYLGIL